MEKESTAAYHALEPEVPHGEPIKQRPAIKTRLAAFLVIVVLIFTYGLPTSDGDVTPRTKKPSFDWDSAATHSHLEYSDCYDGEFKCARLELPMDYWNGTTNATISLAVIRKPAVVPVTDPKYGGAILINPGGPGGSGVGFAQRIAHRLREIVDTKDEKYFDFISFDPRAVGYTRPGFSCFTSGGLEHSWLIRELEEGTFESSDAALSRVWAMNIAKAESCAMAPSEGPDFKKYVTTAYVARDMLEIVEKHGEWREAEAKRNMKQGHCSKQTTVTADTLKYKPGNERIQYWGFSYGSYLGNTFAAMFPDRIERLIVDAVVNAYNYKQGLWSDNLVDAEKDLNLLYYHCARAGYPACALANKTGETTEEGVKRRTAKIISDLYHNPLPVVGPNPEVITYSNMFDLIFSALYNPMSNYPRVARILAGVEAGNGTEYAQALLESHDYTCPLPETTYLSSDAIMAIACSDGDDQTGVDKKTFKKFVKELAAVAPSIGSMWSKYRMNCIHYSVRAVHRFEGPWKAKTSHPLLMIGNTADPVTPVINAINMSKGFEGAVALTQDSGGHASISTFSNCTVNYVRNYFLTGELPPVNTTCKADEMPFGTASDEMEIMNVELRAARERHADLGSALFEANGGLIR